MSSAKQDCSKVPHIQVSGKQSNLPVTSKHDNLAKQKRAVFGGPLKGEKSYQLLIYSGQLSKETTALTE